MAKVTIKFRTSKVSGNAGSIYYQLTYYHKMQQVTNHIRIKPGQWNICGQRIVVTEPDRSEAMQRWIENDLSLLRQIIRDFDGTGEVYTARDIASRFETLQQTGSVLTFIRKQINDLTIEGRFGTARNYQRTFNSFSAFLNHTDIPFAVFSDTLVGDYNIYLSRRGVVRNTISFYMRILRSVYNKAAKMHLVKQTFPFQNVYTGIDRTRKRAVDEQIICRLNSLDLHTSEVLSFVRDLFIFSYGMRGMAFVDIAYLRKTDLSDGILRYTRHKTGQKLSVRLEPCTKEIVSRYAARSRNTPYLFPLLTSEVPEYAYSQYQVALNYYNRLLKRLSKLVGLEQGLSSYTSRHSWATVAHKHNVPLQVISVGMGHTSERTTQIYLMMLENSVIDNANQKILASLNR